jgi:hypothetical protein
VRHLVGALLLVLRVCGAFTGRAAALAQAFGQGGKALGGGFGDVAVRLPGLKLSGAVQMRRSSARLAGWSISAMRTSCVALGWPVNWV